MPEPTPPASERSPLWSFAAIGTIALLLLGGVALMRNGRVQNSGWATGAPSQATPGGSRLSGNIAAVSGLHLPPEKPCLKGPTDVGDDAMDASAGLDPDAVRTVMHAAVQNTLKCFQGAQSVKLMLSVNVACTGRVAKVAIEDDGGATPAIQTCVQDVLKYAAFPAHALPDGDTFEYPLNYTAPTPG